MFNFTQLATLLYIGDLQTLNLILHLMSMVPNHEFYMNYGEISQWMYYDLFKYP